MKVRSKIAVASIATLAVLLSACGGGKVAVRGISPKNPAPANRFMDKRTTIKGPNIEGQWLSQCHDIGFDSYRKFDITFTKGKVRRIVKVFSDANCTKQISNTDSKGLYRFVDKLKNQIYVVEYSLDIPNGWVSTLENVRVSGDLLFVSNLATGPDAGVLEDEPLVRAGGSKNEEPADEELSTDAEFVTSYAEARYAVCFTQGIVTVIDLKQTDLTQTSTGSARIGRKSCDPDEPVRWFDPTFATDVSYINGSPRLDFTDINYTTYIEPSATNSGLLRAGYAAGAFGILLGNSGKCYFLKNTGIEGIPASCN